MFTCLLRGRFRTSIAPAGTVHQPAVRAAGFGPLVARVTARCLGAIARVGGTVSALIVCARGGVRRLAMRTAVVVGRRVVRLAVSVALIAPARGLAMHSGGRLPVGLC